MYFHYRQKMEHIFLILRASRSAPENLCEPSYERLKVQQTCQKMSKSVNYNFETLARLKKRRLLSKDGAYNSDITSFKISSGEFM